VTHLATISSSGDVYTAAFSPDGKSLATGGWERTARLWKIQ
jgi:WD40 repeat protein